MCQPRRRLMMPLWLWLGYFPFPRIANLLIRSQQLGFKENLPRRDLMRRLSLVSLVLCYYCSSLQKMVQNIALTSLLSCLRLKPITELASTSWLRSETRRRLKLRSQSVRSSSLLITRVLSTTLVRIKWTGSSE